MHFCCLVKTICINYKRKLTVIKKTDLNGIEVVYKYLSGVQLQGEL